jgi:hypothetical protein
MSDQQQTNPSAAPAEANDSPKLSGLRISAADKRLIALVICGALGYWFVTSASNSLDGAIAAQREARAEEARANNPWAKD